MKTIILTCILFAFCQVARAQNAFYDSRYIIRWYHDPNPAESNTAKWKMQDTVLTKLYRYFERPGDTSAAKYAIVKAVFDKIIAQNGTITAEGIHTSWQGLVIPPAFEKIRPIIETGRTAWRRHLDTINILSKDSTDFMKEISNPTFNMARVKAYGLDTLGDLIRINDVLTISSDATVDFEKDSFGSQVKTYLEELFRASHAKKIADLNVEMAGVDARLTILIDKLDQGDKISLQRGPSARSGNPPDSYTPRFVAKIEKEIAREGEAVQTKPAPQLSNFSMPTEAQIIDALAIYIAKRFKQEAVMYMLDLLRRDATSDSLFSVVFPETKKMLYDMDEFSVPNFGSNWRYALSKDYTLMPEHLLTSRYIAKQFPSLPLNYLHDGWQIADMVNKKYNYVDIVGHFYNNSLRTSLLQEFIKWAHIANEEFFTTAASELAGNNISGAIQRYWLNPEDLTRNAGEDQMSLMLVMLTEKYKIEAEQFGIDLTQKPEVQKAKLMRVRSWLSRTLLVLNQFQKNQNLLFSADAANKTEFSAVSYWTFLNDIAKTFLDTTVIKLPSEFAYLAYSGNVYEIYNSLQHKNYAAAMHQAISLVSQIGAEHSEFISAKLKIDHEALKKQLNALKGVDITQARQSFVRYSNYFKEGINRSDDTLLNAPFWELAPKIREAWNLLPAAYRYEVQQNTIDTLVTLLRNFNWRSEGDYLKLRRLGDEIARNLGTPPDGPDLSKTLRKYLGTMPRIATDSLVKYYTARIDAHKGSYYASLDMVKRYSRLFNDILEAGNNSEQLSRVIESNAAPVGSYKLKRSGRFSIDLGAYLGAFSGMEWLPRESASGRFVYGLTVPVGLNFNWGRLKTYDSRAGTTPYIKRSGKHQGELRSFTGHSFTLSVSIIDIAAPVAYRLTTDYEPENGLPKTVKWAQLIAPGVHLRWGFKNMPACFSAGVQFTPELREVTATEEPTESGTTTTVNTTTSRSAMRVYAGFLFDLPLLYLKKPDR